MPRDDDEPIEDGGAWELQEDSSHRDDDDDVDYPSSDGPRNAWQPPPPYLGRMERELHELRRRLDGKLGELTDVERAATAERIATLEKGLETRAEVPEDPEHIADTPPLSRRTILEVTRVTFTCPTCGPASADLLPVPNRRFFGARCPTCGITWAIHVGNAGGPPVSPEVGPWSETGIFR